jgi:hypothetical protein
MRWCKRLKSGEDAEIANVANEMQEYGRIYGLTNERQKNLTRLANMPEPFLEQFSKEFPV